MGGNKLAFVRYNLRARGRDFVELWIMNADGTEEKPLVGPGNPESPLYGVYFGSVCASRRGDLVAFIARNLFTITNYSGLDPEVSGLFGDPFQVKMDWFQYPQFRTFSAVVEITY